MGILPAQRDMRRRDVARCDGAALQDATVYGSDRHGNTAPPRWVENRKNSHE
jgi:hypothetical protein